MFVFKKHRWYVPYSSISPVLMYSLAARLLFSLLVTFKTSSFVILRMDVGCLKMQLVFSFCCFKHFPAVACCDFQDFWGACGNLSLLIMVSWFALKLGIGDWGMVLTRLQCGGVSTNKYGGLMMIGFYEYILYSLLYFIYILCTQTSFLLYVYNSTNFSYWLPFPNI